MTLYIYQPGIQPLGQFDLKDGYMSSTYVKGGEIGTLYEAARANSTSEKSAYDVKDGYDYNLKRAVVAPWICAASKRPLWLLDEGTTGYGTLFGSLIGTPVGLCTGKGTGSACSTALGPHTTAGSGKVTCWDKPGIYGISIDAVDTTASNGVVMTNASCIPGAALAPIAATGVITVAATGSPQSGCVCGRFVEFETSPFLVTTPPVLVGATESVVRAVISYHVEG